MTPVSQFSLESHTGPYESWPLKSGLFRDGLPNGVRVPGYLIEGQFAVADKFLLITSYDCPFEESNNFILLDSDCRIVAKRHVGAPYCSFLIVEMQPLTGNELLITYSGDEQCRLTVRNRRPLFRSYFQFHNVSESETVHDS